jgi:hypothetical protein
MKTAKRSRAQDTPILCAARTDGTCAETGRPIQAGDPVLYRLGKMYASDSNEYQAELAQRIKDL